MKAHQLFNLRNSASKIISRGMATEKQLKVRITGTKNIAKITKSMKMVSAAKLRGDQQRLAAAKPFASWAADVTGPEVDLETVDVTAFPKKNLLVVMSTDKGLCGGVNAILCRMTRTLIKTIELEGKECEVLVLGEKGRGALKRTHGEKIVVALTERTMPYNFDLSTSIASEVLASDFDAVHLLFNKFKSAIVYTPSIKSITPLVDPNNVFLHPYDVEPECDPETLQNLFEYTLASQLHHSLLENATAEQSSRMNAMENASKNASEMIEKLTLRYNRARQSRITTELIEIISGAAALGK